MGDPTNAAELELLNNITSAAAREKFDQWWKEDRAAEINERWRIKRKFLDAKGDDPSLQSKYVLVDVLSNPGDHKKLPELLKGQIEKKGHAADDKIWVRIQGCNYVSTEHVCKALVEFPGIEKLSLGDGIEADDAPAVAELIKSMPGVTALDLANNKLETQGMQAILDALKENTTLLDVDMSGCSIGTSGGKHLAAYLDSNPPLQRLLLNGNKLGIYGVQDLCKGLPNNRTLATLGLFFNNMGEDGMDALLEVLRDEPPPDAEKPGVEEEKGKGAEGAPAGAEEPPAEPAGGGGEGGGDTAAAPVAPGGDAAPAEGGEGGAEVVEVAKPPPRVRAAKNMTLIDVEVGDNRQSPGQTAELEKILELNNADAREREIARLMEEEVARLERLAAEKKQKEEEEAAAQKKAEEEAKAAAKPAAKKAGAKPGVKAAAKPAAKPAPKPAAKKPAAKSSLPAIGKK